MKMRRLTPKLGRDWSCDIRPAGTASGIFFFRSRTKRRAVPPFLLRLVSLRGFGIEVASATAKPLFISERASTIADASFPFCRMSTSKVCLLLLASLSLGACRDKAGDTSASGKTTLRFGHFPNITHAQGVIAHALSRQGKGWFEERLGTDVQIQWFTYNAGPSAMEAIFAGSLDLTYVGPGPALNAHFKSHGEEVRVISVAA